MSAINRPTFKREAIKPVRATCGAQQRNFNAFRREYNEERRHENLNQETPASEYQASRVPIRSGCPHSSIPAITSRKRYLCTRTLLLPMFPTVHRRTAHDFGLGRWHLSGIRVKEGCLGPAIVHRNNAISARTSVQNFAIDLHRELSVRQRKADREAPTRRGSLGYLEVARA